LFLCVIAAENVTWQNWSASRNKSDI